MSFDGKATFDAGASLPELADDLADVIGLISPHETPLLDAIGFDATTMLIGINFNEYLEPCFMLLGKLTDLVNHIDVVENDF